MARRQNSVPDWAQRVASLRHRHRLSQAELAGRLRCSAMTISRWERGMLEPSADYYIQLGNLSGDAECWFFWGRAGLQSSDLMRVMPDTQNKRLRTAAYPNLDIVVAGSGPRSCGGHDCGAFGVVSQSCLCHLPSGKRTLHGSSDP